MGRLGSSQTFVRGSGGGALFQGCCSNAPAGAWLQGFSLSQASTGVRLDVLSNHVLHAGLQDLVIEGMSTYGIYLNTRFGPGVLDENASLDVVLRSVHVRSCGLGLFATHLVYNGIMGVRFSSSSLESNAGDGAQLYSTGVPEDYHGWWFSGLEFEFRNGRIADNQGNGIFCQGGGFQNTSSLLVSDSLIARNAGTGIRAGLGTGSFPDFSMGRIERCTLVQNGAGLWVWNSPEMRSVGSILYDNGDDVAGSALPGTLIDCDVGDGDHAGSLGNFSADPLFVDPQGGDFRLQFASPCVDYVQTAAPGLDLTGLPRTIDGDLDALERTDIGAFEHAPLFVHGQAALGQSLDLELWGPAGGVAILMRSEGPTLAPVPTLFGELELDRSSLRYLGLVPIGPTTPGRAQLAIPNDPTLVGRTFSLQARSTASVPSPSWALTNALTLRIVP